ncbi:MAG: bifunctional riboflavin kinase/FAD synthetase [Bacillota bacterium]
MSEQGSVIALGMFDGMHMGHRALLKSTVSLAAKLRCRSLVYTFRNHPRSVLSVAPPLLMTPRERCDAMLSLGIDRVVMKEFDRSFAKRDPREFLEEIAKEYHVRGLVAGYNYTFGHLGSGHGGLMKEFAEENGILCEIIEPVRFGGRPISSSRIRTYIQSGKMEQANAMLAAPYKLCGHVKEHLHIGATIGFPTANLDVDPSKLLPREGVYATRVNLPGGVYDSVTSVGANPTVEGSETTVETYMVGFDGDLYGKSIQVEFHRLLRDMIRFDSVEELKDRIAGDVNAAKRYFSRPARD